MYPYFDVADVATGELLKTWRWFCPEELRLVAVDAFGDLFLEDSRGAIHRLDVAAGQFEWISASLEHFKKSTEDSEKRREWLAEDVALSLAQQGFHQSVSVWGTKHRLHFQKAREPQRTFTSRICTSTFLFRAICICI